MEIFKRDWPYFLSIAIFLAICLKASADLKTKQDELDRVIDIAWEIQADFDSLYSQSNELLDIAKHYKEKYEQCQQINQKDAPQQPSERRREYRKNLKK